MGLKIPCGYRCPLEDLEYVTEYLHNRITDWSVERYKDIVDAINPEALEREISLYIKESSTDRQRDKVKIIAISSLVSGLFHNLASLHKNRIFYLDAGFTVYIKGNYAYICAESQKGDLWTPWKDKPEDWPERLEDFHYVHSYYPGEEIVSQLSYYERGKKWGQILGDFVNDASFKRALRHDVFSLYNTDTWININYLYTQKYLNKSDE